MNVNLKAKVPGRKFWRRLLLSVVLILFIGVNGAGLYMGNIIYREMSIRHTRLNSHNTGRLQQLMDTGKKEKQWQDVAIDSRFGYPLKGTFIPNPKPTETTLIFLHGFTENRLIGLNYLNLYLNAGYNLLLVDSRAHGESGGASVTWGVYEKHDVDQWVDWVRQRFPKGAIGIHGISMGAATAVLHAELNEPSKRVSFYVADSSYSDFESLLSLHIQKRIQLPGNLPPELLLPYANIVAYFNSRFTYAQASPIRAARNVTTPILYIHGEADVIVPVNMAQELYNATKGPRQLYTFPKAEHVSSFYNDRYRYRTVVRGFTRSIPI